MDRDRQIDRQTDRQTEIEPLKLTVARAGTESRGRTGNVEAGIVSSVWTLLLSYTMAPLYFLSALALYDSTFLFASNSLQ